MNKKAFPILLIMFLNLSLAQGANQYNIGDTLYVWAKSGLNVRSSPSVKAPKLGTFTKGTPVIVRSISDKKFNIQAIEGNQREKNPFILKGTWVKVKNKDFEGYVIDTYLLKYSFPDEYVSFVNYLQSFQPEPIRKDTILKIDECPEEEKCFSVKAVAKNGMEFYVESGDRYYRESISIPGMTIEEGFVFMGIFKVLGEPVGNMLERPLMKLEKNFSDRLVLEEEGEIHIQFLKKDHELIISVSLEKYNSYYDEIRPNLYEIDDSEEKNASEFFEIEIIEKSSFDAIKGLETLSPIKNHKLVSVEDSTFSIKLGNGSVKTFEDNNCVCESFSQYVYEGHIEALNMFAVSGTHWEEYSYTLFDSQNGKHIASATHDFLISPEQNFLLSLSYEIYNEGMEATLYRLDENNDPREPIYLYFTNWLIAGKPKWLNDTTFVLPVIFPPFASREGEFHTDYRYLRIRIL